MGSSPMCLPMDLVLASRGSSEEEDVQLLWHHRRAMMEMARQSCGFAAANCNGHTKSPSGTKVSVNFDFE